MLTNKTRKQPTMDRQDINRIEQAIHPFRLGALQDYLTIGDHLRRHAVTPAMLRAYVAHRAREIKAADQRSAAQIRAADRAGRIWREKAPRCENCNGLLKLSPGDDHDSHWWCPACRWGRYDPRPVERVLADLGIAPQPQSSNANPGGDHG